MSKKKKYVITPITKKIGYTTNPDGGHSIFFDGYFVAHAIYVAESEPYWLVTSPLTSERTIVGSGEPSVDIVAVATEAVAAFKEARDVVAGSVYDYLKQLAQFGVTVKQPKVKKPMAEMPKPPKKTKAGK